MPNGSREVGSARIEIRKGDITEEKVDAIVNAANSALAGGGGVDGAIHRAGGPSIMAECDRLGGCPTGDAKATTAGNLPARYVIHTVGPIYAGGGEGEADLLVRCHSRSMEVADDLGLNSVAFPAISCGVYGYPAEEAAPLALEAVKTALEQETSVGLVRFILFNDAHFSVFEEALTEL